MMICHHHMSVSHLFSKTSSMRISYGIGIRARILLRHLLVLVTGPLYVWERYYKDLLCCLMQTRPTPCLLLPHVIEIMADVELASIAGRMQTHSIGSAR